MEITTSVTIPDYVYLFYQKAADELHLRKTEDIMAQVLIQCAGHLSQEILKNHNGI